MAKHGHIIGPRAPFTSNCGRSQVWSLTQSSAFLKTKNGYENHRPGSFCNGTLGILNTVVPGFRVLGFSALPGFRALKAGDGAWSVHKTLFGFRAPLSQPLSNKKRLFYCQKSLLFGGFSLGFQKIS